MVHPRRSERGRTTAKLVDDCSGMGKRVARWPVAVVAFLATSSWAAPAPSPIPPPSPYASLQGRGLEWSLESSTQGNFGPLGIGVGYVGGGDYLDQSGVRRSGLHASLTMTVAGKPTLFQQPDVHAGQMLTVGRYRILIERILPDVHGRGMIILRVWRARSTARRPERR